VLGVILQGQEVHLSVQSGDIVNDTADVVHHEETHPSTTQQPEQKEEVNIITYKYVKTL
jgi:hypothetical protein